MKTPLVCSKVKEQCKFCKHKYYNYGFFRGTAEHCGKNGKFTSDFKECPIDKEEEEYRKECEYMALQTMREVR